MNYLIYDCEIIRPVLDPKRDHFVHPGVEYADSWTDYVKMGIAVICAYESATDRYRVFFQDNFDEFKTLTGRVDLCIGYNNRRFDNPLLEANIGLRFDQHDCPVSYDLLAAIWESLGSSFVRGCSLDSMSRANGLPGQSIILGGSWGKTCTGALAPVLWQQGNRGTVVDYCLHDVWLVKRLMEKVFTDGYLSHPTANGIIKIKRPGERVVSGKSDREQLDATLAEIQQGIELMKDGQ